MSSSAADGLLALIDASTTDADSPATASGELLLTTREVRRRLRCRGSDLSAAAVRLEMLPGVEVWHTRSGQAVVRRVWPAHWLEELEIELNRTDAPDIADLCGLGADRG